MRYTKFYMVILMAVMVFNIAQYHLPYIEYNLFKDYIAKNLCVKKNEPGNCCQGHCFLEKQIELVNETDENANNPTENKHVNWNVIDDYVVEENVQQATFNLLTKTQLSSRVENNIIKRQKDIPSPPPKRFV